MMHLKKKTKTTNRQKGSTLNKIVQRKYLQSIIKQFPALEKSHTQSGFYEDQTITKRLGLREKHYDVSKHLAAIFFSRMNSLKEAV